MKSKNKINFILITFVKEFFRKSLHASTAIIPIFAEWNIIFTIELICFGTIIYILSEIARITGARKNILSPIVSFASRRMEIGFAWGPVTLALGILLSLLMFSPIVAKISIYAVAFGDGIASLAGKVFGNKRLKWFNNKSFIGSIACFALVFLCTWLILSNYLLSAIIALVATIIELIPFKNLDNIFIPLGTGLVSTLLL